MWRRFSPVAMICVGAVTVAGLRLGWKHVGAVSPLWTTGYGTALLVKILLVVGLVTAGAFNQFRLRPRIARAPGRSARGRVWVSSRSGGGGRCP
ncbi:CopD family protein [Kitasatospora sp. NBC_01246]|uniref:CopD family protein n=1 Tax=Kitasatospora sp. NBC_01246 TaxID=2903570 RepID=UPI002E2EBA88|nr:CopD family protein [Kitasatospora sp. NBC_01246]